MLFSATLDGAVKALVARYMHDPVFHEVESDEPTVEEMEHRFFFVHEMDKVKVAAAIAAGVDRTLMFCNTKRAADRSVARARNARASRAAAIHGDLSQAAREKALADFMAGKVPVLVATDVAARGIHVDGVDVVVHYEPTDDDKTYIHRSRSHRPRRRDRRRRDAHALEPGERDPGGPAASRPPAPDRRGVLQRPPPRRPQVLGPRRGRVPSSA